MHSSILRVRVFFFLLCLASGGLAVLAVPEWEPHLLNVLFGTACLGALVILVDVFLKGFSLRGLTSLTFGLGMGALVSHLLYASPLFEHGDAQALAVARFALFLAATYLCTVIALRGRDEFHLVIPYVRFVPHGVQTPIVVVDTSALIDGRIAGICASRFLGYGLVVPRFVLDELQRVADSSDPGRQARGRKGLDVLNQLRRLAGLDLRIHESELIKGQNVDSKLIFLAQSLKARLLTTDYNLAQLAEFHGIEWLNLNALAKALHPEVAVGETVEVELVKPGKENGQAVGFLADGSMVVVNDGRRLLGQRVRLEVQSVLPSAGGKMVFARPVESPGFSAPVTPPPQR